jgi:hypothetical protein
MLHEQDSNSVVMWLAGETLEAVRKDIKFNAVIQVRSEFASVLLAADPN